MVVTGRVVASVVRTTTKAEPVFLARSKPVSQPLPEALSCDRIHYGRSAGNVHPYVVFPDSPHDRCGCCRGARDEGWSEIGSRFGDGGIRAGTLAHNKSWSRHFLSFFVFLSNGGISCIVVFVDPRLR